MLTAEKMRASCGGALDGLSDQRYRDVLAYRYIRGMTWEQVARETGYEIAQIYRLHGRALIEVNRALDSR